MTEQLYPREPCEVNRHLDRRWRVDYSLVYDGGGGGYHSEWSKGYRTSWGARLAAWWEYHFASCGGLITITDTEDRDEPST